MHKAKFPVLQETNTPQHEGYDCRAVLAEPERRRLSPMDVRTVELLMTESRYARTVDGRINFVKISFGLCYKAALMLPWFYKRMPNILRQRKNEKELETEPYERLRAYILKCWRIKLRS